MPRPSRAAAPAVGLVSACALLLVATVWAAQPRPVGDGGSQRFAVALGVAGDSAVWAWAERRFASPVEIRAGSPGRPPVTILRGDPTPGDAVEQLPFLDAGPRQVVVSLVDFVRSESGVRVVGASAFAGAPDAPLQRLDAVGRSHWAADVAVSGDRVALLVAHRTRERARLRLVVRDMRTGKERTRLLSREAQPALAFAGKLVAIVSQRGDRDLTRVAVRDVESWRVHARARVREDAFDVAPALRPDGTLALAYGWQRYRAAVLRSGSRLRVLPVRPASREIRFAPGGVVYPQRVRTGVRLIRSTLDGRVRALTAPVRGYTDFDVGGGLIAVRSKRCIYLARIPAREPAAPC